jgi:hypothetical protein
MILTPRQADIVRWSYVENRRCHEIAVWLDTSVEAINKELYAIRCIFASHGKPLPKRVGGRPLRKAKPEAVGAI